MITTTRLIHVALFGTLASVALAVPMPSAAQAAAPFRAVANVTSFASGLQYPRGLRFGTDGVLYVAEAGEGATNLSPPAQCELAGPVVRPYSASATGGRISRVDASGKRSTLTASFPRAVN